jgi:type II protein arginine methyltransferase
MKQEIDALKKTFREGAHAEAIAGCEALCVQELQNLEAKRLCATMHLFVREFARSLELFKEVLAREPANADVLFNVAMCERELKNFKGAAERFKTYTEKFPNQPDGWAGLAECQSAIGQTEMALTSFTRAIEMAPNDAGLRVHRGDTYDKLGKLEEAAADYKSALVFAPGSDEALKKATLCLLQLNRGEEGIQLCRDILKVQPESLTAKLGAEWLLSQIVPTWHGQMMNEEERNAAYYDGLRAAITPEKTVFEIGTGSGLLAMMSAKLGAKKIVTCEAVRLVADTARKIIERNKYQDKITVLAKPSSSVQIGRDLPAQADILVHEVFSSELLGEHVLPSIEDAKARLLKPGGEILPGSASIMIALVGGDELGKELHVDEAFGFDLRPFNSIQSKKRPIQREDLPRVLLSADVEAFHFDFRNRSTFPPERKRIDVAVSKGGLCYGVIQWIRFDFGHGVVYENHPSKRRKVASWQQTVYRFDEPLRLAEGANVSINAMHDRSRPWFEQA